MNLLVPIFGLIHIGLFASILYYLHRLKVEKCECAFIEPYEKLYKATFYILCFRIIMFVIDMSLGFTLKSSIMESTPLMLLFSALGIFMIVIYLLYFIYSIKYINMLYASSCKCSDNSWKWVYYIYSIYSIIIVSATVLFIVFMLLILTYVKAMELGSSSRKHK
jgi:hypothetical protein